MTRWECPRWKATLPSVIAIKSAMFAPIVRLKSARQNRGGGGFSSGM